MVTEDTGDPTRIAWIDEKDDLWMSNLELATPHLVVELAKIKVHNHDEGFARESVRLLMRRVMTFALNNNKLALAKDQLRICGNNGGTHLDISACQPMTLSVAQAKELLEEVNSELLAQDNFHETPSQVKEKQDGFAHREQEVIQKAQSIDTALMRKHAAQVAEINIKIEFRTAKQTFLSIREPVVLPDDASSMAKSYLAKGLLGRIGQLRLEVELEQRRLMAISLHSQKQIKELSKELRTLKSKEELRKTTKDVIRAELAKMRSKEKLVDDKKKALARRVTIAAEEKAESPSAATPPAQIVGLSDTEEQ